MTFLSLSNYCKDCCLYLRLSSIYDIDTFWEILKLLRGHNSTVYLGVPTCRPPYWKVHALNQYPTNSLFCAVNVLAPPKHECMLTPPRAPPLSGRELLAVALGYCLPASFLLLSVFLSHYLLIKRDFVLTPTRHDTHLACSSKKKKSYEYLRCAGGPRKGGGERGKRESGRHRVNRISSLCPKGKERLLRTNAAAVGEARRREKPHFDMANGREVDVASSALGNGLDMPPGYREPTQGWGTAGARAPEARRGTAWREGGVPNSPRLLSSHRQGPRPPAPQTPETPCTRTAFQKTERKEKLKTKKKLWQCPDSIC